MIPPHGAAAEHGARDVFSPAAWDTTMCFLSQQRTVVVLRAWPDQRSSEVTGYLGRSRAGPGAKPPAYSTSTCGSVVSMDASVMSLCPRFEAALR